MLQKWIPKLSEGKLGLGEVNDVGEFVLDF